MTLPRGTALGPYEILDPLGAGGMGEVYRARDRRLDRDVAIKIVGDALAVEGRARFEREAKAASALSHPNICAVHDVGEADGRLFFVMELVNGVTLGAHAGGRPLEPSAVIAIATQIADALDAAHAHGIVHRDIKPGNVLITTRGHIKVTDFGVALRTAIPEAETIERLTISGRVVGTPAYMAPELLRGAPADARTDIWALGVVLHELLVGHPAYRGTSAFEISAAILNEAVPRLPESVPTDLRAVIDRCLAKHPDERYQRASDVRAALERLEMHSAPRVAGGVPRWAASVVVAVVLLGALAAWLALRPSSQDGGPWTSTGAPASANQEANEAFELAMNVQRVQSDLVRGQQLLERAITLDPHFAEALRYHALSYALHILNGETIDTSTLYKAEQELQQVAREAPALVSLPSAQAAVYLMQGRRELAPTEALDRVLAETPSHRDTIFWRAILAWLEEDNVTVKDLTNRVLTREPLWSPPRMFLADTLRTEGDSPGAIRELEKILEQAPANISAVRLLVLAYLDAGDLNRAQALVESRRASFERNYMWRLTRALLLARQGRREDAIAAMDEETLKFAGTAFVSTLDAAEYYALLGDVPRGLEWLERAIRNGDERLTWFRKNPRLAGIRQDPRFAAIMASLDTRRRARTPR
jgi:predicted Zn-dependent protease